MIQIGIKDTDQRERRVPVTYTPLHVGNTWQLFVILFTRPTASTSTGPSTSPTEVGTGEGSDVAPPLAPTSRDMLMACLIGHDALEVHAELLSQIPDALVHSIERQPLEEMGYTIIKHLGREFTDGVPPTETAGAAGG